VKQTATCIIGTLIAIGTPVLAGAQPLPTSALESAVIGLPAGDDPATQDSGVVRSFLRDVGGDYKHFLSKETAIWLGAGGGAALAVHPADQPIADWVHTNSPSMPGGSLYGSQLVQIPVAIGWWLAGSASGSARQAAVGRDLLRAELSVASWTYAFKFASNRTRPNGDPRSFPSGHASTSFTVAMVLQEHFGWKVGLPAFAAATYTGLSRLADNHHWASDVVFGAALGMASGRTVTLHLRDTRVSIAPLAAPGGGGVLVTVAR
jgi:membrane-associated phospholipid phosphatase